MFKSETIALGAMTMLAGASLYVVATRGTTPQSAPNRAVQQPKQQRQQSTTSSSGGGGAKQAPDPKYIGDGENDEVGINDMSPDEETEEGTTEETDSSDG